MPDVLPRVRAALAEASFDALLVGAPVDDVFGQHGQNRRYLTGFTGSAGTVLVTATKALLAVDFRYLEQAEREAVPRGYTLFRTQGAIKRWFAGLCGEAGLARKKLGLSRADVTLGDYVALQETIAEMPEADRPELVPAPPIVEQLRRIKAPGELDALQHAIDIADAAFERVAGTLRAGTTEREVARAIDTAFLEAGAESPSFATIVAGGPWGAMPHAHPRDAAIETGQPVVIDMGARHQGYCSDLTRTITAGPADAPFDEIYAIVLEAQQSAIARVEPGMTGAQAHELAHEVMRRHGYGDQFGHGLGHGVGLQVHESPYLGPTSEDTLEEGMVFTIEPGIYLPGWGGIRIEDIVLLEGGRARVLSHAKKRIPLEVNG